MRIGISRPPAPPDHVADIDGAYIAQQAERIGFEAIFYGEHPVRPLEGDGYRVHADGPPFFQDSLVMLARASALTSTIMLGGGVFLIPEHHPVRLGKQLASLDHYSGGRLVVGVGVGWSRGQVEALGGDFDRRWDQATESVGIMRSLWRDDVTSVNGEFYRIPPVVMRPKPATPQGPPVLVGAKMSRATARRVAAFADGWLAVLLSDQAIADGPDYLRQGRAMLEDEARRIGRDPSELSVNVIVRGPQVDGDLSPRSFVGRDYLRRLEDLDVDYAAISLPTITSKVEADAALARIADGALE